MIKLVPGFDDDALLAVVEHCYALRAIVLELYGTGNSPSRREDFVRFIQARKIRGGEVRVGREGSGLGISASAPTVTEGLPYPVLESEFFVAFDHFFLFGEFFFGGGGHRAAFVCSSQQLEQHEGYM